MKKLLIIAAILLFGSNAQASAQATGSDIRKIENYLNSIKTLEARFVQNASNGSISEGKIWIEKPNKLRMEYDAPENILIIGNGDFIVYNDKDLDQVSNIDYDDIPATIILGNDIKIDGDEIKMIDFYKDAGITKATVEPKKGGVGPIELTFSNSPFELKQWKIVDPQSVEITVSLYGSKVDQKLDEELFIFKKKKIDPIRRGR